MKNILKIFMIFFIIIIISSCGEILDFDPKIIIEDSYKEHGEAFDELWNSNAPQDNMGQIVVDVELVVYPNRIVYLKGIDNKVVWEGCKAKQLAVRPERELIYSYFVKDRHLKNIVNYYKLGIQLVHVKMNALTFANIDDFILLENGLYSQYYTKNIIIPIQIISETFYDDVKESLLNPINDADETYDETFIFIDEIINAVIIEYPSRIAYLQGFDSKLIWDGCLVEITTDDEILTVPITNTELLNLVYTDVDFDVPGVYPVIIRGEGYELAFAVQVITENFYQETLDSLLK